VDTRTAKKRSEIMRAVRTANTGPEMEVRSILHRLGFRFRTHNRELPGRPDVVLRRHRKVVFVHGCFWHGHRCSKGKLPKSRLNYWAPKIATNKKRDTQNLAAIRRLGWQSIVVWQCELRNRRKLVKRLNAYMQRRQYVRK